MDYYPKHIGDYARKAGRLSFAQHGVYTLLLDACYDREAFPTEQEAIDWVWAETEEDKETVRLILKRFFVQQEDGRFVQNRVREELERYHSNKKASSEGGKKSAELRKARSSKIQPPFNPPSTPLQPPLSFASTNQEPITKNQEPITNNQEPITNNQNNNPPNPPKRVAASDASDVSKKNNGLKSADFEYWYEKYPHKVGKAAALKAFQTAIKAATLDQLVSGLELYVKTKPPDRAWCNPATWLNQERWLDKPAGIRDGPKLGVHVVPASERANSPEALRTAALFKQYQEEQSPDEINEQELF